MLDTSVVRRIRAGESTEDVLRTLQTRGTRFSLPSTAVIELVLALQEERVSWDEWIHIRGALDVLLDADEPFVRHTGSTRLRGPTEATAPDDPIPYWRVLRAATSRAALAEKVQTTSAEGTPFEIEFSLERSRTIVEKARARWVQLIDDITDLIPAEATLQRALEAVDAFIDVAYLDAATTKPRIDAYRRVIAHLVHLRSRDSASRYNPRGRGREGDALDVRLLHVLSLPAVLLTADEKLVSRVRQAESTQANLCLAPSELLRQMDQQ